MPGGPEHARRKKNISSFLLLLIAKEKTAHLLVSARGLWTMDPRIVLPRGPDRINPALAMCLKLNLMVWLQGIIAGRSLDLKHGNHCRSWLTG